MSDVAEKIRAIFDKHLVWDCFGYMAEMEKEVLAAVAELEQQITTLKFLVDTWEKPVIKHKELELRLSEIREQWNRLPKGIIEVGGITLQNLLRFKEWSDKMEKLLDGEEQQ